MATDYSRVDEEIALGRLWRAKEILIGRLAQSAYDADLFGKLAMVLQGMHDDDEAGRFHLLAGNREAMGGELASRFLARRQMSSLADVWHTMPKAARRRTESTTLPAGTIELLKSAGRLVTVADLPIKTVRWPTSDQRRRNADTRRPPPSRWSTIIGIIAFILVMVILAVGAGMTLSYLFDAVRWFFGWRRSVGC